MSQDPRTAVVYLSGARGDAFSTALGERYRVLLPASSADAHAVAEYIRSVAGDGSVDVIADSAHSAAGCWLAILSPELVRSLVLIAPSVEDAAVVERLGEISAATLVLCASDAEPEASQTLARRISNSYRVLVYGPCSRFADVAIDFIERGDRFVVAGA